MMKWIFGFSLFFALLAWGDTPPPKVTIGTSNGLSILGQAISLRQFDATHAGAVNLSGGGTTNFLRADGSWAPPGSGTGSVTSVALSLPSIFTVSGSPVTTTGTLTGSFNTQTANTILAGPSSGGASTPTFRLLVANDIPSLPYLSSTLTSAHLFVGNGSNVATDTAASGDLSLANTGAFTVQKIQSNVVSGTTGTTNVVFSASPTLTGSVAINSSSTTAETINTNSFVFDATNNALGIGTAASSNTSIDIVNSSSVAKAVQTTGYGHSVGYRGRYANGTSGSPTASVNGDLLNFFSARGYGDTSFALASTGAINITAGATFTDTSMPTYMSFNVTPSSAVSSSEKMRLNSTGHLLLNTTTDNGTDELQVNGSIVGSNLSGSNTGDVTVTTFGSTPNANGLSLSGQVLNLQPADATHSGGLKSADWSTFNGKQNALTFGNLTDVGTDGITIGNGSGAVIGSGTTVSQHVADTTHSGYLSSTDWNTFNGKLSSALTSAHILVGNVSAIASDVAVSGDLTLANTGAFTIANNAVTTAKINNSAVTYAKIQNVSANSVLLGSGATGSGAAPVEISLGTGLTMTGTTLSSSAGGYNQVQSGGSNVTQRTTLNFTGTGISAVDDSGNTRTNVALNSQLQAFGGYNTNGLITQTAANTYTGRTITGTSGDIVVTNGDGVSGNPTLDIGTNVVTLTGTQTLTNKRMTKRVVTATDATSITPNTDNADITYQLNTQSTGTLTINADTGTPTNGQAWLLKIKSTNVQTFSWNSIFVGGTVALPTTTTGSTKIDYYAFTYDTVNSKWDYTGGGGGF